MKRVEKHKQDKTTTSKKTKKIKIVFLLIYIMFFLSIILLNGRSKLKKTYATQSTATLAKMISNIVYDDLTTEIDDLHNQNVEWNFSVTNYNVVQESNIVNEVSATYRIKIELGELVDSNEDETEEELEVKLYKVEGTGQQQTKTEIPLLAGLSIQSFNLINGSTQQDNFCLEVKTTDEVDQSELEGNITVKLITTQTAISN